MIVKFAFKDGIKQKLYISSKNLENIKQKHPDLEVVQNV